MEKPYTTVFIYVSYLIIENGNGTEIARNQNENGNMKMNNHIRELDHGMFLFDMLGASLVEVPRGFCGRDWFPGGAWT